MFKYIYKINILVKFSDWPANSLVQHIQFTQVMTMMMMMMMMMMISRLDLSPALKTKRQKNSRGNQ
jgi:hypothetical protein